MGVKKEAEIHILNNLRKTHRGLYESYITSFRAMTSELKLKKRALQLQDIRNTKHGNVIAFRLVMPKMYHLSLEHAVSRFRHADKIPAGKLRMNVPVGYIPGYCPTMDLFTVFRVHGELSKLARRNAMLPSDVWQIKQNGKRASTFSSINSILRGTAQIGNARAKVSELFKQYLNYFFWSFPSKGYTGSPHMVPGSNLTRAVYKVTKTLFGFEGATEVTLRTLGQDLVFPAVKLIGLMVRGNTYQVGRCTAIATTGILEKLKKMKRHYVMNGAVTEFIRPNVKPFYTLTLVTEFVDTWPELLASLFGIVARQKFYSSRSPTHIGATEKIWSTVDKIDRYFGQYVGLPRTVSFGIKTDEERKDYALRTLRPIFAVENGQTYCLPPMLASSLESSRNLDAVCTNQESLLNYLRMTSKLHEEIAKHGERNLDFVRLPEFSYFVEQGANTWDMAKETVSALPYLNLTKTVRRFY